MESFFMPLFKYKNLKYNAVKIISQKKHKNILI